MWEDLRPGGLGLVPEKVGGLLTGFAKHLQDVLLALCPTSRYEKYSYYRAFRAYTLKLKIICPTYFFVLLSF